MIRYDKKLEQEINRTIKNFNQKIARLEKTERELIIPERITKKQVKEDVQTRQELRRRLDYLKKYSDRGIEETIQFPSGEKMSKYEYELLKEETRRAKIRTTAQIKKLKTKKVKIGGVEQDTTFAESGTKNYLTLKTRLEFLNRDIKEMTGQKLDVYKKALKRFRSSSLYYDNIFMSNYIDIIEGIADFYGYSKNRTNEIKEKLMLLDSREFTNLFNEDQLISAIIEYSVSPKALQKKAGVDITAVSEDIKELMDELYTKIDQILIEEKNIDVDTLKQKTYEINPRGYKKRYGESVKDYRIRIKNR